MPVISWNAAQKVAGRLSGREPFSSSYLGTSLDSDFHELTKTAEGLVEAETGLQANGPARVVVASRDRWVQANIAAMQRLLRPVLMQFDEKSNSLLSKPGQIATGAQIGAALGWMSARVLGQYDLLLLEDENPADQDIVYYVGPNILALEKRYAFPPREFRLWIALHECTHRAQFTGVPWLADYFRGQVDSLLQIADPTKLNDGIKHFIDEIKDGRNPLDEGGILTTLVSPEQKESIDRISALMSLLEGHGDVTMARAGADLIPNAERFHRVMHARRTGSRGVAKFMQRFLGFEAKLRQYAAGERFFEEVEKVGGVELSRKVWKSPEYLPTLDEIKDPALWTSRIEQMESNSVV